MKDYRITETITTWYDIEAENEEEAYEKLISWDIINEHSETETSIERLKK